MIELRLSAQELLDSTQVAELGSGLTPYLTNLINGRKATPRSWLYEGEKWESVLDRWNLQLDEANSSSPFADNFTEFDRKQIEKVGPQGEIPSIDSEDCKEVVEPLYSLSDYDLEDQLREWFPYADEFGKMLFGAERCLRGRPLGFNSVVNDMSRRGTLTTNSGFPYFTRRRKVLHQDVQNAQNGRAYCFPAVILFRNYHGKLRPVWMFPLSVNLIENTFVIPVQDWISHSPLQWVRDYCTPWAGFDHVKRTLSKQWPEEADIVGGDTTKMDAHMRPAQLQLVYRIVRWAFQKSYWQNLEQSIMHISKIHMLWKFDKESEKYVVLDGIHGLASGSGWTQLAETVLQLFMAYIADVQGQGIGDDFYWISDMDADALVSYLGKFGLPANPAKQTVSKDHLSFLQRYFCQGFFSREDNTAAGAYYPTIRALGSMLLPERFHDPKMWSVDMFCIRNYMILENCVDNPCFDKFVEFVVRGHKEMSSFAKKTAAELNSLQTAARKVPGLFPNYNQEKVDRPLSAFASIRVARAL